MQADLIIVLFIPKKMEITKKENYQKPTIQVVEIKQQCHILAGSNPQSTLNVEYEEEDA